MNPLISPLPPGPLDIIGDIHGEYDALLAILDRLDQRAPSGAARPHLVFVGDLIDRGPDSIAVCKLVSSLVAQGRATCILGNHELNALRGRRRSGNGWFFGEARETWNHKGDGHVLRGAFTSTVATDADRTLLLSFFETMPLAAQRDDLRVVHAAWFPSAIAAVGDLPSIAAALARSEADATALPAALAAAAADDLARMEAAGINLSEVSPEPFAVPAFAEAEMIRQNSQHVAVLTSGPEEVRPSKPEWRGGKWRVVRRSRWWNDAVDMPTLFGHYWRLRTPAADASRARLFEDAGPTDWLGPHRNAYCLDYSVGRRYFHRDDAGQLAPGPFPEALGALRWRGADQPAQLWFDDRDTPVEVAPPGTR